MAFFSFFFFLPNQSYICVSLWVLMFYRQLLCESHDYFTYFSSPLLLYLLSWLAKTFCRNMLTRHVHCYLSCCRVNLIDAFTDIKVSHPNSRSQLFSIHTCINCAFFFTIIPKIVEKWCYVS